MDTFAAIPFNEIAKDEGIQRVSHLQREIQQFNKSSTISSPT